MTREQIEKSAEKWAYENLEDNYVAIPAFIAGAESRQQEIYDLIGMLEDVLFCIDKGFEINVEGIKNTLKNYEQ